MDKAVGFSDMAARVIRLANVTGKLTGWVYMTAKVISPVYTVENVAWLGGMTGKFSHVQQ